MPVPDGQPDTGVSEPPPDAEAGGQPGVGASDKPGGWKFALSWIVFAITLLLTVWLGVEVIIGTKGFG